MVKIFAKLGTDQKAIVVCQQGSVRYVQIALSEQFGGNWIWVDNIQTNGEILLFTDGMEYLGFHGKDERYCKGIQILK